MYIPTIFNTLFHDALQINQTNNITHSIHTKSSSIIKFMVHFWSRNKNQIAQMIVKKTVQSSRNSSKKCKIINPGQLQSAVTLPAVISSELSALFVLQTLPHFSCPDFP